MILVVGSLPDNSGKTTVATSIIAHARENGVDVGVFKPVTAVNGWYHHEVVERSKELGVLTGNDVFRLHEAAESSDPLEIESPLTSLMMPPDPDLVDWRRTSRSAVNPLGQTVLIRSSGPEQTAHYSIAENMKKLPGLLKSEIEELLGSLDPAPQSVSQEEARAVLTTSSRSLDDCLHWLSDRHELMVIESYSNAAAPSVGSLDCDAVVAVAPGKAALFEGERYRSVFSAKRETRGFWQLTTDDVLSLLTPLSTFDLAPGDDEPAELLDALFSFD